MTFGKMPIANGFLTSNDFGQEYWFELAPAICDACHMFQLVEQPSPDQMFHSNYAFYSSTSSYMQQHFARFAHSVMDGVLAGRRDPLIVELGSNDGIMLRHFKNKGLRHLGIEPSANVAQVAREQGINTVNEFFDRRLAERIVGEHGYADVVLAANVMCHIADLPSVADGIKCLLKPDGVLMFEDPYLGDMIDKTSYDQIYDEHVFIFSALSVSNAFQRHGLELIDVLPQVTHGGSMRYVLSPVGARPVSASVELVLAKECVQGLSSVDAFMRFKRNCESQRTKLISLLERLRTEKKMTVGYGATSKSTTVLNYCGINSSHIAYISDTTPIKHGKFTPGTHIPILPHEEFKRNYPDYAVLFAWNHSAEIRGKEEAFVAAGGKWIQFVPMVQVLP